MNRRASIFGLLQLHVSKWTAAKKAKWNIANEVWTWKKIWIKIYKQYNFNWEIFCGQDKKEDFLSCFGCNLYKMQTKSYRKIIVFFYFVLSNTFYFLHKTQRNQFVFIYKWRFILVTLKIRQKMFTSKMVGRMKVFKTKFFICF